MLAICPDLGSDPECRDQECRDLEIKDPAEKDPEERAPEEKDLEDHLRVDQVEAEGKDKVSVLVALAALVAPVDPVARILKDLDDQTFKPIRLCVLCGSVALCLTYGHAGSLDRLIDDYGRKLRSEVFNNSDRADA